MTAVVDEGGAGNGFADGSSSAFAAEKSKLSSNAESNLNLDTAGLSPDEDILPRASSCSEIGRKGLWTSSYKLRAKKAF